MVAGAIVRPIIQRVVTKYGKKYAVDYARRYGGELAGSIAGIGISAVTGDYYGAFRDFEKHLSGNGDSSKTPPFGYYEGTSGIDGPANGTFSQTLRPTQYKYYNRKYKNRFRLDRRCKCYNGKRRKRSTRRFKY